MSTPKTKFVGVIQQLYDKESPSEKFSKREMVINCSWEYEGNNIEAYIQVQATQNKILLLDAFKVGDKVVVEATIGNYATFAATKKGNREEVVNNVTMLSISHFAAAAPASPAENETDFKL